LYHNLLTCLSFATAITLHIRFKNRHTLNCHGKHVHIPKGLTKSGIHLTFTENMSIYPKALQKVAYTYVTVIENMSIYQKKLHKMAYTKMSRKHVHISKVLTKSGIH
jgi:hypothetical protein